MSIHTQRIFVAFVCAFACLIACMMPRVALADEADVAHECGSCIAGTFTLPFANSFDVSAVEKPDISDLVSQDAGAQDTSFEEDEAQSDQLATTVEKSVLTDASNSIEDADDIDDADSDEFVLPEGGDGVDADDADGNEVASSGGTGDILETEEACEVALTASNDDGKVLPNEQAAATDDTSQDENSTSSKTQTQSQKSQVDKGVQEEQTTQQGWTRLWGTNALGTMREIAGVAFKTAETVVIATIDGYWDALTASALAGSYNAPILLTASNSLSSETSDELARLKAKKIYLIGGVEAINDSVYQQLAKLGLDVQRLWGATAPDTAVAVAQHIPNKSKTAIVATVDSFHDALSIASYAYATKSPVFLTLSGGLSIGGNVVSELKQGGYTKAVVVGGEKAVAPSVVGQIERAGVTKVVRLGGSNAYETSVKVAAWGLNNGMTAYRMGVACGQGYWDALTGSALLGKNKSVLVLADESNYASALSFINSHRTAIVKGYLFGGTKAVSGMVMDAVVSGKDPLSQQVYSTLVGIDKTGHSKVGIDVSRHNDTIDWAKVKASGVGFAILRVGYGSDMASQDDDHFLEYVRGARAVGLPLGVYLYSYGESAADASSEADHTLRMLKQAGLKPSDVPYGVYYDLEEPHLAQVSNRILFEQMATVYCTKIKDAGYTPGVYSSLSWWNKYLVSPMFEQWRRWVAQWNDSCSYAGDYLMWQCSSTGRVPGISTKVDMNLWYG